jgi:hypothetical protein
VGEEEGGGNEVKIGRKGLGIYRAGTESSQKKGKKEKRARCIVPLPWRSGNIIDVQYGWRELTIGRLEDTSSRFARPKGRRFLGLLRMAKFC